MRRYLVSLALAGLASSPAAAAPTFLVNSPLDVPDSASQGDGVCETAPGNGVCTLRAAVMEANGVAGGGATIRLPAGEYVLTRPPVGAGEPQNGDLDLTAPVTIVGDGPSATIVDGGDLDRVFAIPITGDPVVLRGLAIRNGRSLVGGGGIFNEGDLRLENVALLENEAPSGGGLLSGVTNQSAQLSLRHCIVAGNRATDGGGAGLAARGTVAIADSLFQGNAATAFGGAILAAGDVRVERTLVDGNETEEAGGGIAVFGAGSELLVRNGTISRNDAGTGGAAVLAAAGGAAQLLAVTVAGNRQVLAGPRVGALAVDGGALVVRSSIVAGNLGPSDDGMSYVPSECGTAAAPVQSGDYDLIGDRESCFLTGLLGHVNAADLDPELRPLAPAGGFAASLVPDGSSPAIEAIPPASCTDELGSPLREDERGYRRTGPCDIGAYESSPGYAADPVLGVELLRNGGAAGNELGLASPDGSDAIAPPYWRSTFAPSQIAYGAPGYPLASETPPGSGVHFLGGGILGIAFAFQEIDLSAAASAIDAGEVTYRLAGAFGGYLDDDDHARLDLLFFGDGGLLATVTIGDFSAADRNEETKLLPDSAEGVVPPGSRTAQVYLEATAVAGASNDGYADDLSLVLAPEPTHAAEAGLALAVLSGLRRRREGRGGATG